MAWDRTKFEATCSECGQTGFVIKAEDDWGRSDTTWIGFGNRSPSSQDVARKRAGARDSLPLCACGSSAITSGKILGPCDYAGNVYKTK